MTNRLFTTTVLCLTVLTLPAGAQPDPLAAEIARWSALLADARTEPLWVDAKKGNSPALAQAEEELRQGRRLVALERFHAASQGLAAALYAIDRPEAERKDLAALEAEWKRAGAQLRGVAAAAVQPALLRALAELSAAQARESYDASLEYGRNTEPLYGFYYLGAAKARHEFLRNAPGFARAGGRAPSLRSLRADIDALQGELLAGYRPPASIEKHSEFIVASSALKEARELDAAGERHAALLRYLQAAQRTATIREIPAPDRAEVARRVEAAAARLTDGVDHSIARLFVERAQSALAGVAGSGDVAAAAAIAASVLPRYFAAIEPARAAAAAPEPRVTVTLVRWPFT